MEIVTPEIESEVAEAIRTSNQAVLRKYGRFLEPISQMVQQRLARYDQQKVEPAMKLVASPITMDESSFKLRHAPPNLNEHGLEVLSELGYTPERIAELRQAKVVA